MDSLLTQLMLGCQLEPILWRQWVRVSSRCFSASCLLASLYFYVCSVIVSSVLKASALATLRPLPAASSTALLSLSSACMARDRLSLVSLVSLAVHVLHGHGVLALTGSPQPGAWTAAG